MNNHKLVKQLADDIIGLSRLYGIDGSFDVDNAMLIWFRVNVLGWATNDHIRTLIDVKKKLENYVNQIKIAD